MKCAKCGKELEHYPYCIQDGKYYCSGCAPVYYGGVSDKVPETITSGVKITLVTDAIEKTIRDAKLDFSKLAEATVKAKKECQKYGIKRIYYYCTICKRRISEREFNARSGECRNCWTQVEK